MTQKLSSLLKANGYRYLSFIFVLFFIPGQLLRADFVSDRERYKLITEVRLDGPGEVRRLLVFGLVSQFLPGDASYEYFPNLEKDRSTYRTKNGDSSPFIVLDVTGNLNIDYW